MLKIITAGDAIYIEQFTAEVKSVNKTTLHGRRIYLPRGYPACGDKLFLERGFSTDFEHMPFQ